MSHLITDEQAIKESEATRQRLFNINQNAVKQSIKADVNNIIDNDVNFIKVGVFGYTMDSDGIKRKLWQDVLRRTGEFNLVIPIDNIQEVDSAAYGRTNVLIWTKGINDRKSFKEYNLLTGEPTGLVGENTLGDGRYIPGTNDYVMTSESDGVSGENHVSEHGYPLQVIRINSDGDAPKVLYTGDSDLFALDITVLNEGYIIIEEYLDLFGSTIYKLLTPEGEVIPLPELPSDVSVVFSKDYMVFSSESEFILEDTEIEADGIYAMKLPRSTDDTVSIEHVITLPFKSMDILLDNSIIIDTTGVAFFMKRTESGWAATNERIECNQSHVMYYSNICATEVALAYSFANYSTGAYTYIRDEYGTRYWVTGTSDSNNIVERNHVVTSKDGTQVSYTILFDSSAVMDGRNPTIVNAYGSFGATESPYYQSDVHKGWLHREVSGRRHGMFVYAHIRGSGSSLANEYSYWHMQTVCNKELLIEDINAIVDDLERRGYTSREHLGFLGYSAGGLLAGNLATETNSRFASVVSAYPLLDMKNYQEWGIGSSWLSEFGDYAETEATRKFCPVTKLESANNVDGMSRMLVICGSADLRTHYNHGRSFTSVARSIPKFSGGYNYIELECEHVPGIETEMGLVSESIIFEYFRQELA